MDLDIGTGRKRVVEGSENAFGYTIPTFNEIVKDPVTGPYITSTLTDILKRLDLEGEQASALIDSLLTATSLKPEEYERVGHEILVKAGLVEMIQEQLKGRAKLIFNQINPYLFGAELVDLGCGDGQVGRMAADTGFVVTLADVYQHSGIPELQLLFSELAQGGALPFKDRTFDTSLLLTVLHHSDDPAGLFKEAMRITRPGGRIIVIESVFGVEPPESGNVDEVSANFLALDSEQQREVGIFFDHFYNRLFYFSDDPAIKVNVPFNFNTPDAWDELFLASGGYQIGTEHLRIDQPIAHEYHTLHVVGVL